MSLPYCRNCGFQNKNEYNKVGTCDLGDIYQSSCHHCNTVNTIIKAKGAKNDHQ